MSELYFMGVDIIKEAKDLMKLSSTIVTNGMTKEEVRAYDLGTHNAMAVLDSILNENGIPVVNINGLETPTELSVEDLENYYLV
jgi:hypothetical protein